MKNILKQVLHSPKFMAGFLIFVAILLVMLFYPLINPGNPLEMIGLGTFAKPGTYVSLYDSVGTDTRTFKLPDADDKRIARMLAMDDRVKMVNWLSKMEIDVEGLDVADTEALLALWRANYDEKARPAGMIKADINACKRVNKKLQGAASADTLMITEMLPDGGTEEKGRITKTDYVNISDVANVKVLPLGTDNFGRDVLKELVSACGTSILIGLLAGTVATLIGLTMGLLAGYLGGVADDLIMFLTNIFTVIPSFAPLILISYSIGSGKPRRVRGGRRHRPDQLALDGPFRALAGDQPAQPGSCESVPAQRPYPAAHRADRHPSLHRQLCGHGFHPAGVQRHPQRGAALPAGPGPENHRSAYAGPDDELGHAVFRSYQRFLVGDFPVILTITLISFSLNLMNTGLDQVFNPTLRN